MKKYFVIYLSIISTTLQVSAQTEDPYEAFRKKREQEMQQFKAQQERSLDSLREAQNRDFALLLEGKWIERTVDKSPKALERPKPETPPVFNPLPSKNIPEISSPAPQIELKGTAPTVFSHDNVATPEAKANPEAEDSKKTDNEAIEQLESNLVGLELNAITYFGTSTIAPDIRSWPTLGTPVNASQLSTYWKNCTERDNSRLLAYIQLQRTNLQLSDWGLLKFMDEWTTSNAFKPNDAKLFKWFWCIQLGYDVRLMYYEQELVLGYPFREMFYGQSYITSGDSKYFLLDHPTTSKLFTYDGKHSGAQNAFTIIQNDATIFPEDYQKRIISFDFDGEHYAIPIMYNTFRSSYYASIPQTELSFYFSSGAAISWNKNGYDSLRLALASFNTDRQRVRFLYAMVNNGIPYATDDEQFDKEKCCLPEEVLKYSHADCEDRTFLLNHLIRTLVGAPTIGLHFPGHVAMAVSLDEVHASDTRFTYDGATYIYCDPTYIGADIGMMPEEYVGVKPEVFK